MNEDLARRAARNGAVFGVRDALSCGYSREDLRRLVRRGVWVWLGRGAYADADRVAEAADFPYAAHRFHVAARLLRAPIDTVAGHWSGVVVHDFPMLGRPPTRAVLTRSTGSSARDRFVKVATLAETDRTQIGGIRVTTSDRTVVDIARRASFRSAVVVADAALRSGLAPAKLAATAGRLAHWPYGSKPVVAVAFADGRSESPLESIGRVAMHEQGVELPELQVEVWCGGQLVARVDHLWERHRTIGEADGLGKYEATGALRDEKRRQEWLEQLGFVVVRYGWDDAYRKQSELADRIRNAFTRGAAQSIDPRVRLVRTQVRLPSAA